MDDSNERWKTDGDCDKCRRQKYCKRKCKAYQQTTERLIKRAIVQGMADLYKELHGKDM